MNSRWPATERQRGRTRRAAFVLLGVAVLGAAGCTGRTPPAGAPPAAPSPGAGARLDDDARAWVERTAEGLSLRRKVAQMVIRWIPGGYVSTESAEFDRLAELVDLGIGGVSISVGLPHSYAARLNALQRRAEVPLLVASDFESGGPGMRLGGVYALPSLLALGGGTELPPTMAFGAIGEERFARRAGLITGREARAVGVHLTFAPVMDVNSDPANPIINTRSFGEDPALVGRLGAAFVHGAREAGLLTTAKHFPGHGDTRTDSHLELPVLDADSVRLDTLELAPFRAAVRAGVDAVMTAHLTVPGLEGADAPPATFSPYFLGEVLRERMGFRGLVITDAMTMDAIAATHTDGEAAVRAVRAGADVLLSPLDVEAAVEAVVEAVERGRINEARIDASVRRILEAKARAGLHEGRRVDLGAVDRTVGRREHLAFADTAAVRSLTLVTDRDGLVPLDRSRVRRVLSVSLARDRNPAAGRTFDRTLAASGIEVEGALVGPETPAAVYDSLARRATEADAVLLSVYLPPEAGAGSVAVPTEFAGFVARSGGEPSTHGGSPPLGLISFGNPYLVPALPGIRSYLIAWGGRPPSQRAAARALLGEVPVTGRLPVSLSPRHRRGEGLWRGPLPGTVEGRRPSAYGGSWWRGGLAEPERSGSPGEALDPARAAGHGGAAGAAAAGPGGLARVDSLIRRAIADSVTPGAALAVGRAGKWVRLRGYGRTDWDASAPAVTDSTLYDLASLTKVVGTATALVRLVAQGRVHLDSTVARYLPAWEGTPKEKVTVRQLLLHRGGLPAHRPWWRELRGEEAYHEALRTVELAYPPGDSAVYSDLGFMALGMVVEAAAGEPLDRYLRRTVFGPLGMGDTRFRPPVGLRHRIAPTEVDTFYRHRHVHGEVHDENAHAMGGVAGHAGLFGSARDLAVFAQTLLNGGWGAPRGRAEAYRLARVATPGAIERFTVTRDSLRGRALGWTTVKRSRSGSGSAGPGSPFGRLAYGHTGFTGTSLWIDPERELFVALLTNRVNPTRAEEGHRALRRDVHRAVIRALGHP